MFIVSVRSKELFAELQSRTAEMPQVAWDAVMDDACIEGLRSEYDIYYDAVAAALDVRSRDLIFELEEINEQLRTVLMNRAYLRGAADAGRCMA